MKENVLVDLPKGFAIEVINLCSGLKTNEKVAILTSQLLRSGTSIGANIHEGNYAASRADFINKFQIALKECYETDYWLDIFKETDAINEEKYNELKMKNGKIRKILIASITTAKSSN